MPFEMEKIISEQILHKIIVNGEEIGTVEYNENAGWHTMIKTRSGNGSHMKLAQGFGETKEDSIKNSIEQGILEAKEYVTQLQLLSLTMYGH